MIRSFLLILLRPFGISSPLLGPSEHPGTVETPSAPALRSRKNRGIPFAENRVSKLSSLLSSPLPRSSSSFTALRCLHANFFSFSPVENHGFHSPHRNDGVLVGPQAGQAEGGQKSDFLSWLFQKPSLTSS